MTGLSTSFLPQASLSREAETVLIRAIEEEIHGDSFYFWFAIDNDPRNSEKMDFWTFCDAINAGNCRLDTFFLRIHFLFVET